MDKEIVSAEELAAEQAATQLPKEEEVRAGIVSEYGFDEEADKERIDKMVVKEMDNRKKLSTTIGQKIKYRELAKTKAPEKKEEVKDSLSEIDVFALVKADVAEDDIAEVKSYAKYRGVSVSEALKDKTLKSILSEKAEERRSADVSNTSKQKVSTKLSPEVLREKAKKGDLPDSDIDKLVEAEMTAMVNRNKR